ncbi:MAG: hypothetical protein JJV96_02825 [Alphaproteobacteria bacterium]|nr:hypothetical protein [Alphaproteobacteria bacterium]
MNFKKLLISNFLAVFAVFSIQNLQADYEDPLFLLYEKDVLLTTSLSKQTKHLLLKQEFAVGISDRMNFKAGIGYRESYDNNEDGQEPFNLALIYRTGEAKGDEFLLDVFLEYELGGNDALPQSSENTISVGLRGGYQFERFTSAIIVDWNGRDGGYFFDIALDNQIRFDEVNSANLKFEYKDNGIFNMEKNITAQFNRLIGETLFSFGGGYDLKNQSILLLWSMSFVF